MTMQIGGREVDEDKTLAQPPISDGFQEKKVTPYELLMRQSRKMGGVATRTLDVTKEFLKQDVSSLHPDKILFSAKALSKSQTFRSQRQNAADNKDETRSGTAQARASDAGNQDSDRDSHTLDPREGLRKIVRKSHQLLATAQTVILPINLFPDSVKVDRTKVTITKRTFFWSSSVISIRIEDVLNISCSTGPIFGSLTISSRVMNSTDHYEIDYFWRKDALYLKQLIQGYVIAQHNQIETSHLDRKELVKTLLEIGSDSDY